MRALKYFAIAVTPFILNAELIKTPDIQDPLVIHNAEHPNLSVKETPLILNAEMSAPVQEVPAVTKTPEPQGASPSIPVVTTVEGTKNDQVEETSTMQPMSKTPEETDCSSPFHGMHAAIRHTESKGVGYKDGYTTLEWFGIYDFNPSSMPFLDIRGHVFNNGKLAANVGLGDRIVIPSINHTIGLYLYYDVRQGDHQLTVNQLSPGIEVLGKRMEYRINAYFPVGKNESNRYQFAFDRFEGNRMIVKSKKKYAMTGFDSEVGTHITQSTRHDFYFGIGPYYFTADPNNSWGGKTRLYWRFKEYVFLEASYSYDRIFKNVVQGTVAFSYPFGKKLKRKGRNCPNSNDLALSRAAFAPYRFEIPVIETHVRKKPAKSAVTGQPLTVWFVDNTSNSAGTYESPFPTLTQAKNASEPNDMIYVFPGDGTTSGMNTGIVLKDGQTLYGSGTVHNFKTKNGYVQIPALSSTAPSLTHAGSILTLANGNEVSGLNLLVTQLDSSAIDGSAGISGANINRNTISGSVNHRGIHIVGQGTLLVQNNTITGPTNSSPTSLGVDIDNLEQTSLDIEVVDNVISGYNVGLNVTPLVNPTSSSGTVVISGNTISGFDTKGIDYSTGMRNGFIYITDNNILNNAGSAGSVSLAVILNESPNSGTYFIDNNHIVTTTPAGGGATAGLLAQINLMNGTSAAVKIRDNNILVGPVSNSECIFLQDLATDVMCVSLSNNTVRLQNPATVGLRISTGTGTINIDDFSNNIFPATAMTGNVNFVAPGTCSP